MITIDRAHMLCLDQRWKTRAHDIYDMQQRFEKMGIEFKVFIAGDGAHFNKYDYVDEKNPDVSKWLYGLQGKKHHHWNALQCHKRMLMEARRHGCKNVLMLEDDAYLTSRFEEIWPKVAATEQVQDFHLLYLGWWIGDENDEWNILCEKNWAERCTISLERANQVGGLHGCLVDSSLYEPLIESADIAPIDFQLNRSGSHGMLNSWVVCPKLIHTRTTFSFCEGQVIPRNEL